MMVKKKILATAVILGVAFSTNIGLAEPIVELAAPRTPVKIFAEDTTSTPAEKPEAEAPQAKTTSTPSKKNCKKVKKYICKKPAPIKLNYDRISKMIEYGYYDEADRILEGAIERNPKDIKAQALWVVSLSKQCKLDPAQQELNILLKKYPNNSNLHYAQGVVYYQRTTSSNMAYRSNTQNLLNNAMSEFKKSIDIDKTNARAYNAAGVISIKQGNQKAAIDYFKKALATDKTYSMAIDNLGTIDFSAGKIKDAEAKFKQSLAYNTQNTTAMYHLAQIAIQKQDYSTAITYLNNALYINQNSPAIYNLLGKAYAAQGNEAAAINAFKQSTEVKPEFTVSYLDLADIYNKRGDSEFAIEQLKTALSIDSNYCDARLKLGDILLESGKYKQAIDTYAQLVGVEGYNDYALKGLASSYYAQAQVCAHKSVIGSNKEAFMALDSLNKAIKANPNDLELHLAKLKLSRYLNQPEQTKAALNKIVTSPDKSLSSLIIKGEAYISLNDYKNANDVFTSATKLSNSTNDDMYLAEILLYNKQFGLAQSMFNKILKYDAKNSQALSALDYIRKTKQNADNYYKSGMYFAKQRNFASAIEYLSRSISCDPDNAQAHLELAQIYEKKKNYKDAIGHYRAFVSLTTNENSAKNILKKITRLGNEL